MCTGSWGHSVWSGGVVLFLSCLGSGPPFPGAHLPFLCSHSGPSPSHSGVAFNSGLVAASRTVAQQLGMDR